MIPKSDCDPDPDEDETSQRSAAVRRAWKDEQSLVRRTGEGTYEWSDAQKKELLQNGTVSGFHGHHINSVKCFPGLAGNPDNIEFQTAKDHLKAHGGSYRNPTQGDLLDRSQRVARLK